MNERKNLYFLAGRFWRRRLLAPLGKEERGERKGKKSERTTKGGGNGESIAGHPLISEEKRKEEHRAPKEERNQGTARVGNAEKKVSHTQQIKGVYLASLTKRVKNQF